MTNYYRLGATATSGMLDGHPDYVQGIVAAGITYLFSTKLMHISKRSSAYWAGLALILELL